MFHTNMNINLIVSNAIQIKIGIMINVGVSAKIRENMQESS